MNISNKKVFVTGHKGMVGSSVVRLLKKHNCKILFQERKQLDLTNQKSVFNWFSKNKPEIVINAAGRVGGILENATYPADFIFVNSMIALNLIHASYLYNVKKLINLGSACIYPKKTYQPIAEDQLLTGKLEQTNEAYAIAKISAIKLCEYYNKQYKCDFISLQPTNLFGQNDNFDLKSSHVLPALIRKIYFAKKKRLKNIYLWGTGNPKREFLYVDDLADAIFFTIKKNLKHHIINVGSGEEISIKKLAKLIAKKINYKGKISFDIKKPDGVKRRIVDSSILFKSGWRPKIDISCGIDKTIKFFKEKYDNK